MYQPGETACFDDGRAAWLVESGRAVDPDAVATADPSQQGGSLDSAALAVELRQSVLFEIFASLDPQQDFTLSGKPEVSAVNALLSDGQEPVDATERDAAWLLYQALT